MPIWALNRTFILGRSGHEGTALVQNIINVLVLDVSFHCQIASATNFRFQAAEHTLSSASGFGFYILLFD
jgi:hypothetical protein